MKCFCLLFFLIWPSLVISQIYEEPPFILPLPPPVGEYCGDIEKISQPVMSYRISAACEVMDIQLIGGYQYGAVQVKQEVSNMRTKKVVRRLVSGSFVLYNEVNIELHRASEETANLVCTVDMMGKKVIDAKIVRQKLIGENKSIPYDESIIVDNNQLPNLGIFTYTREVRYTINNCPEITR
ncbi:MAG: hypothetical protein ACI9XC_000024 [Gammaproteobacteria bacterium]|jgi:hypothetical protein